MTKSTLGKIQETLPVDHLNQYARILVAYWYFGKGIEKKLLEELIVVMPASTPKETIFFDLTRYPAKRVRYVGKRKEVALDDSGFCTAHGVDNSRHGRSRTPVFMTYCNREEVESRYNTGKKKAEIYYSKAHVSIHKRDKNILGDIYLHHLSCIDAAVISCKGKAQRVRDVQRKVRDFFKTK